MTSPARRRTLTAALITLAIAATASPGGALAGQDLRSPDARDAASGYRPSVDTAQSGTVAQDLRSPDARDAATGYRPTLELSQPTAQPTSPGGFDWLSWSIGVVAATGLLAVITVAITTHRHATMRM
jgi:hypothetical protein